MLKCQTLAKHAIISVLFLALSLTASAQNKNEFPYGGEQDCQHVGVDTAQIQGHYTPWFCETDEDCAECEGLKHGYFKNDFIICDRNNSIVLGDNYNSCVACNGTFQAEGMGYGQKKCELACGAAQACDEFAVGSTGGCGNNFACNENCECEQFQFNEIQDEDNDGVPDHADACPETPLFSEVGPNGCPSGSSRKIECPSGFLWSDDLYGCIPDGDPLVNVKMPIPPPTTVIAVPEGKIITAQIELLLNAPPEDIKYLMFAREVIGFRVGDNIRIIVFDSEERPVELSDYSGTYDISEQVIYVGNQEIKYHALKIFFRFSIKNPTVTGKPHKLIVESKAAGDKKYRVRYTAQFTLANPPPIELANQCISLKGSDQAKFRVYFVGLKYPSIEDFSKDVASATVAISSFEPFKSNIDKFQFIFNGAFSSDDSTKEFLRSSCPNTHFVVLTTDKGRSFARRDNKEAYIYAGSVRYNIGDKLSVDLMATTIHEFGHIFGSLSDEYDKDPELEPLENFRMKARHFLGFGNFDDFRPNCANNKQHAKELWGDLESSDAEDVNLKTGYYEGCTLSTKVRSTTQSIMFDPHRESMEAFLSSGFGAVNERCILKIIDQGGSCTSDYVKSYSPKVRGKDYVIR